MKKTEKFQQEIQALLTKQAEARAVLAALPEDAPDAIRCTLRQAVDEADAALLALNDRIESYGTTRGDRSVLAIVPVSIGLLALFLFPWGDGPSSSDRLHSSPQEIRRSQSRTSTVSPRAMDLNDKFNLMTTKIEVEAHGRVRQGTGFFYGSLGPKKGEGPQWRRVDEMWVATNRHVLLPTISGKERVPEKIILYLRRINERGTMEWIDIALEGEYISKKTRFHPIKEVDVALVDIWEQFNAKFQAGQNMAAPYFLHAESQVGYNNIMVEVGDDVLVAGYPRGFYDHVNLFPIVKAGIIASRWGTHFQGKPYFLIDAKLFPGSSGSVVVSKPIDFIVKDGAPMFSKEKQFALLGIFSGEPELTEEPVEIGDLTVTRRSGFNLGIVWYAQVIEEARTEGVGLRDAVMVGPE